MNDDMSKAEIEKMEIKKKIHDINKVLYPQPKIDAKIELKDATPTPNAKEEVKEIEGPRIDINKLRKLCLTKHGLVNDSIRKIAWPLLLNADVLSEQSE